MQPQFYLSGMLIGPEKFVSKIVFLFLFLFKKIQDGRKNLVLLLRA